MFNNSTLDCPDFPEGSKAIIEGVSFWVQGVAQIILAILGICFNVVFAFVLSQKELRNSFNILLIVLSFFDTCFLIGSILESVRVSFNLATALHVYLFPYFLYPGQSIAMTGSIFMTVAISFERYVAVHNPIDYNLAMNDPRATRRRVTKFMIPVIFLVFVFSINKFFEAEIVYHYSGPNNETVTPQISHTDFRVDPDYVHKINWSRLFVLGIIPVALLIYFNRKIYQDIKERERRRRPKTAVELNTMLARERTAVEEAPINQTTVTAPSTTPTPATPATAAATTTAAAMMGSEDEGNGTRLGRRRVEDKMALLFMGIVLAFLICNFPRIYLNFHEIMILDNAIACYAAGQSGFPVWFWITTSFSHLLLVLNSSFNMFVYCLYNTKFRQVAQDLLSKESCIEGIKEKCCCCIKIKNIQDNSQDVNRNLEGIPV